MVSKYTITTSHKVLSIDVRHFVNGIGVGDVFASRISCLESILIRINAETFVKMEYAGKDTSKQ